ncbi:glyQS, partial [Symbiodinium microadriaticum]
TDTASALQIAAAKAAKRLAKVSSPPDVTSASLKLQPPKLRDLTQAPMSLLALLPSPVTGTVGVLSAPRQFNLMFRTSVGAVDDQADPSAGGVTYLRPETAQGIFTNFVNMQRASRLKIPFGIAQVGKAFRNEITPRNFIFRSREFEMMEIEFFIPPDDDLWEQYLSDWLELSWRWLLAMGLRPDLLSRRVHVRGSDGSGLAHYAKACTDIEFRFPFGSNELMGVAARGSYDLDQHGHHSGRAMEYTHVPAGSTDGGDMEQSRKYVPHTIEPSIGLDRLFLALLTSAYREDVVEGEKRVVLSLHPALAPVKACVMPLLKNRPEIMQKATVVFDSLRASGQWNVEMDLSGSIGKRYRRADEIGTPFCITVDVDSVRDECVTLRHRDTTRQERIPIKDLTSTLERYLRWDS